MRIDQVDPTELREIAMLHHIEVEVGTADDPGGYVEPPFERTVRMLRGELGPAMTAFLGFEGGHAAAAGRCVAGQSWAYLLPIVAPGFRRCGHGTAMLRFMEERECRPGPKLLRSRGDWDVAHGPRGDGSAVAAFAARHGFRLGRVETASRLALPVAADRLDSLAAERAQRRRHYRVTAWSGPTPEEFLAGLESLSARRATDGAAPGADRAAAPAPAAGAEPRASGFAQAHRDRERFIAQAGQTKFSAVVHAPDRELVGYSWLTAGAGPSAASQQWTGVASDHRGRGLGLAMKIELLAVIGRERPDIPAIRTHNVLTNQPIVSLNAGVGYVRVSYTGNFDKPVTSG